MADEHRPSWVLLMFLLGQMMHQLRRLCGRLPEGCAESFVLPGIVNVLGVEGHKLSDLRSIIVQHIC